MDEEDLKILHLIYTTLTVLFKTVVFLGAVLSSIAGELYHKIVKH